MAAERIRIIIKYLAKQKLKGVLVVLILIPALFIGFKWIALNPDSTSSEEQSEQAELQEEGVVEEPTGETPTPPASRGAVAGESQPEEEPSISVEITLVTSSVRRGADATLNAKTLPNAVCSITVDYGSGPSEEEGLEDKNADSNGNVFWTWMVGTRAPSGLIVVKCSLKGKSASAETSLAVVKVDYSTPPWLKTP